MNSYDIKFRERTIAYLHAGHTYRETSEVYGISTNTLVKWAKKHKKDGDLRDAKPTFMPKKITPSKLEAYLLEHPDAYQSEIAEHFGCSQSGISRALKRLGYKRKKR